jgi:hypothetical protein
MDEAEWRAREDLNLRPPDSKSGALIQLSYGRNISSGDRLPTPTPQDNHTSAVRAATMVRIQAC